MDAMTQQIQKGLENIFDRIHKAKEEAGRTQAHDNVELVAVSKFHTSNAILAALSFGQKIFGESYAQEALQKQNELSNKENFSEIQWHFVGHIQSRKAKDVVGNFSLIHSVDSLKLVNILNTCAENKNICQKVLIQVNIGNEAQKSGIQPDELTALAKSIMQCNNLSLQGLMCLPPVFDAGLAARPHFAFLRKLKEELSHSLGHELKHLSMGMSGDLEAAIFEGATLVRVGTDIFGSRSV